MRKGKETFGSKKQERSQKRRLLILSIDRVESFFTLPNLVCRVGWVRVMGHFVGCLLTSCNTLHPMTRVGKERKCRRTNVNGNDTRNIGVER